MYIIKQVLDDNIFLIRDPIYGFIELPESLRPIVDHPLVQRLRWVSQLPLEQIVYPSAQHSRFEHSLGVMYLAMQAAITLLNDQISREKLIRAKNEEDSVRNLDESDFKKVFILAAGIVGILHDVGHGPFSHTIEDVYYYCNEDINKFNHENLSFVVSKYILNNFGNGDRIKEASKRLALNALNKSRSIDDLKTNAPISAVLRNLIDGPIDVDKGDYLLRDSYHCGVIYGLYDKDRLWRHIRLSNEYDIAVSPKGALEAWTLRFARYKMYKNVYKHHVRNITDAILIDTLSRCIENDRDVQKFNPFINISPSDNLDEDKANELYHWTDDELIRKLDEFARNSGVEVVKQNMDRFKSRKLPKILVSKKTSISRPDREKIRKLREEFNNLKDECGSILYFMWVKTPTFPVYDGDTMSIKVVIDDREKEKVAIDKEENEIPLMEYLSVINLRELYGNEKKTIEDLITPENLEIQVYVDREGTCNEEKKKKLIEEIIAKVFDDEC